VPDDRDGGRAAALAWERERGAADAHAREYDWINWDNPRRVAK
jgi:hypothetical protein